MDDLRALLAAATPGPWRISVEDEDEWYFGDGQTVVRFGDKPYGNAIAVGSTPEAGPSITLIVAAVNALPALLDAVGLLREAIEVVHQTESLRDHADPNDKTGWNVHGIETCADSLCVDVLAALARLEDPK